MSTSKKLISLVLCLVMVIGTIAVGFCASADDTSAKTIPTYAELDAKYDNFVYIGLKLYEVTYAADGTTVESKTPLAANATISEGADIYCEAYVKSDYELYKNVYLTYVFDSRLFTLATTSSFAKDTDNNRGNVSYAVVKRDSLNGGAMDDDENETVASYVTNYTIEDEANWVAARVTLGNAATAASGTIKKNQITTDFTSDEPICGWTLKTKSGISEGFTLSPADYYTCYAGNSAAYSKVAIGAATTTGQKVKADNLILDADYTLAVDNSKTVTYHYNDTTSTETVSMNGTPAGIDTSVISNFYKWADKDGNFVDPTSATITDNVDYYAVKTTDTVAVTFDPNGGTVEGSTAAVTKNEPVTGYTAPSATNGDAKFAGWVDAAGNKIEGSVTPTGTAAVTYTASWGGEVPVKVLPLGSSEWVDVCTYTGTYGQAINTTDFLAIQKELNKHLDEIEEAIGADTYGLTVTYGLKYEASYNEKTASDTDYFKTINPDTGKLEDMTSLKKNATTGKYERVSTYTFGGTLTGIYLVTTVTVNTEVYKPQLDADGNAIENADGKYGFDWDKVTLSDTYAAVKYTSTDTNTAGLGYYNSTMKSVLNTTGLIGFVPVASTGASGYSTAKYTYTFKDSKGTQLSYVSNVNYTAASLDDGTVKIYVVLSGKEYYIGYEISTGDYYSAPKEVKYGDTVTLSDIASVAPYKRVYSGSYADYMLNTEDLYESGAAVDKNGYKLTKIYYTDKDGNEVVITDDTEIVIDEYILSKYAVEKEDLGGTTFINFKTEWEAKEYTFNLYYQNAQGKWVKATTATFTGADKVTYAALVGTGSELESKLKADCPESVILLTNIVREAGSQDTSVINAYEAEATNGVMNVYAYYGTSSRNAFIDYNNATLEDGSVNEMKTGENVRYKTYNMMYADTVYDPDLANEEQSEIHKSVSNFSVATNPATSLTSEDVETGEFDEQGNAITETQTTYTDVKASASLRPYRNCEYIGYTVYYVDGVYTSFADLPDQSTWKKGYNDKNEKGAQHIYTTVIYQINWMADSQFKLRVYDDVGNLSCAKDTNGNRYYWDVNGKPCKKGENTLVEDKTKNFCVWLMFKKETYDTLNEDGTYTELQNGKYLRAYSLGKDFLNMNTIAGYIPVIIELVKGLIKSGSINLD